MESDNGRLGSSLQGISAYGSPLMHADISIFSNGKWNIIGRSGSDGSFIIPPNDNIELPALLRAQLTSEMQLEMIEASENTEEALSGNIQTITYYGIILSGNQRQVSITPWSTAALSNAVGQHIATLSDAEVELIYPSNFVHSSEISDEMKSMLSSYFEMLDIPLSQDPMAMVFDADGTGFDGILDMFDFSIDFQSGEIIIHNIITQQSASVTSQEVMDIDNDLFDINNQNLFSSSKVTQWQEDFASYFDSNSNVNIREIVDPHYLNNTITLNGIQEEFESYKNNGTPISIHLPRIKDCDITSGVCKIKAIVSVEAIDYVESRTLYLKFSNDGRAKLYGNQHNHSLFIEMEPALHFRQNIQEHLGSILDLRDQYVGFNLKIPTSPLWDEKFIPVDVDLLPEYDEPEPDLHLLAYTDYSPTINYDEDSYSHNFDAASLFCRETVGERPNYRCVGRYLVSMGKYDAKFTHLYRGAYETVKSYFDAGEAYLRIFSSYGLRPPYLITHKRITEMPFSYDELAQVEMPSVNESDLESMRDWRGENNLILRFNAGDTVLHSATIDIPPRNGNSEYIYTHDLTGQNSGAIIIPQLPFMLANDRNIMRINLHGEVSYAGKVQPYEWQIINCIGTASSSCSHNGWKN